MSNISVVTDARIRPSRIVFVRDAYADDLIHFIRGGKTATTKQTLLRRKWSRSGGGFAFVYIKGYLWLLRGIRPLTWQAVSMAQQIKFYPPVPSKLCIKRYYQYFSVVLYVFCDAIWCWLKSIGKYPYIACASCKITIQDYRLFYSFLWRVAVLYNPMLNFVPWVAIAHIFYSW